MGHSVGETPNQDEEVFPEYTIAQWKNFLVYLRKLKDFGLTEEVYAEVHMKAQKKIEELESKNNPTPKEGGNL